MSSLRKRKATIILFVLVLFISVGYALLSTDIKIVGASKIKDAKWDIHLENLKLSNGSVEAIEEAEIDSNKTTVNYNIELNTPGEYYEFLVDVVNSGTIDGMIDSVTSKIKINDDDYIDITNDTLPKYLKYSISYANGGEIKPKYELKAGGRQTYKVRVEYNKDIEIEDLPLEEQSFNFMFSVNYVQKDSTSIKMPELKVGDYFSLKPDKSTYTISSELSGCSDQTISLKELNLWRVISKNDDGSFDAISEYTSTADICFKGVKGYANLVGGLEEIANQYSKAGYTKAVRNFGYNGQTLTINDTSTFDSSNNTSPSDSSTTTPTTGEGEEFNNGVLGDNLYLRDYNLVKGVYNSLKANKAFDGVSQGSYWRTSRVFNYTSDDNYSFLGGIINNNGELANSSILRNYDNNWNDQESRHGIRPIITLNPNLFISNGTGSKNSPYQFS